MSFDPHRRKVNGEWVLVEYPNRKDWRKQYIKRGKASASDRPNGGCPYCYSNRFHSEHQREEAADEQLEEYKKLPVSPEDADILAEHDN